MVSGPSGAGKSTIIKRLRKKMPDLGYSISHTSRRPRGEEVDGVDYHFVDREGFEKLIEQGAFVEWAEVYGDLYGTSLATLENMMASGVDVLMDVDSQGAMNIKMHFRDASTLIYLLPPSLDTLKDRLRERGTDDDEVIESRMKKAGDELKECLNYDYLIVNDDLEKAVAEVEAVIVSGRCRKSRMLPKIKELFDIQEEG